MRILIEDVTATPEQFQEIHGKGLFLGSSEIATAAGLNKFQTPLQLWMRKTGRDVSVIDNYHTRLGQKMERVVAETFCDEYPNYLIVKCNSTYQDEVLDWATCTPDYFARSNNHDEKHILEIKTSGIWAKKEWQDGNVPDYALIQLQWQMGICGIERGFLAALIGGKDFYCKEVQFSKDVFAQLMELGHRFIELIKSDTPPEATYADDLSYIRPTDRQVELTGCIESLREFDALKREISALEAQVKLKRQTQDTIKNKIIQLMGDASRAYCGNYEISRKIIPIKESVRKAYDQIRFSVKNKETEE